MTESSNLHAVIMEMSYKTGIHRTKHGKSVEQTRKGGMKAPMSASDGDVCSHQIVITVIKQCFSFVLFSSFLNLLAVKVMVVFMFCNFIFRLSLILCINRHIFINLN